MAKKFHPTSTLYGVIVGKQPQVIYTDRDSADAYVGRLGDSGVNARVEEMQSDEIEVVEPGSQAAVERRTAERRTHAEQRKN